MLAINIKNNTMNILTKTTVAVVGVIALTTAGSAFAEQPRISKLDRQELRELRQSGDRDAFKARAQELGFKKNKPQLTEDQKQVIKSLKESGDRQDILNQLDEWGIEKPQSNKKGLRKSKVFEDLTQDQQAIITDLRESGVEKEQLREQLAEFGVNLPGKKERPALTEEQKEKIQELKAAGDREGLRAYFEEIGLKKTRIKKNKRTHFIDSLSVDESEILHEARNIARAGDKETAQEMIKEVFASNTQLEKKSRGIRAFFKKIFN